MLQPLLTSEILFLEIIVVSYLEQLTFPVMYTFLFRYRSPSRIPEIQLSEEAFIQTVAALRFEINRALTVLREIAFGRDLKKFLTVSYLSFM